MSLSIGAIQGNLQDLTFSFIDPHLPSKKAPFLSFGWYSMTYTESAFLPDIYYPDVNRNSFHAGSGQFKRVLWEAITATK